MRSRGRSGSVSETTGVTYIMRAFHVTQGNSPIFFSCLWLRPDPRTPGARTGKSEVDGSDPPFLLPGSGAGALRNSHLHNTPWGVAPVQIIPGGKA